ncbi:hypothetical protein HMPREF1639_00815 [Peptostreptococcus sp. MV1]|uniref:tetratricopeptide repeat protein n=1 Tax=Peptostreptococcus sp. MV1 TaxID=1219626 RepID=UPI00051056AE|nr:hypothetical protein [Peptostreptococcus sp. MV1]KGF15421.1 hypothetical protein HMPREF1639_00815 [Peptostreptococcus sp. MV1]
MASYNDYSYARSLLARGDYRRCYDTMNNFQDRDAEWFFLRGVSAMNLGFYEEGEDYIKRAKFMEPGNREFEDAYNNYINDRSNYNQRADYYNRSRNNLDNSGCCCCGGNCCDTCCTLWCADSCCECMGGDLITCC